MEKRLEKILTPQVLLLLNMLILVVTELSGDFFREKGIIHLIAILFVILGISRIFVHYDAYDRYLRLLIRGGLAALIIFSISHVVEFLGYFFLGSYEDAIFINVVNFYIMSIFMIAIGAEYFLRTLKRGSMAMIGILSAGIIIFFVLTVLVFFKKISVSLEPDEMMIYVYGAIVLGAFLLSVIRLIKIKKHVSIMVNFVNYFLAALALITVSALQYVFYDVLKGIGMPLLQVVYVSHFLFYGALTLMFLAFARLANLGGIYQEAEEYKKAPNEI